MEEFRELLEKPVNEVIKEMIREEKKPKIERISEVNKMMFRNKIKNSIKFNERIDFDLKKCDLTKYDNL